MKIPLLMIFQFFLIISSWATKALEDGKITAVEGLELVISLAGILGVKPEFSVSDFMPRLPGETVENDLNLSTNDPIVLSKSPAFPIDTG